MISQDGQNFIVQCDFCSCGEETFYEETFTDALYEAQAAGWRIRKNGKGDWEHACPDCSNPQNDFNCLEA